MSTQVKKNTKSVKQTENSSKANGKQNKDSKKASGSKTTKNVAPAKDKKQSPPAKKTNNNEQERQDRYFKIVNSKTKESKGRYTGDTPKQAASKAFTKMLQQLKKDNQPLPKKSTIIYLRESTRGSARKVYGYEAARLKLDEPQELTIKDKDSGEEKVIVYNYRNKIKKVAVPEDIVGGKSSKSSKKGQTGGAKKSPRATSANKKSASKSSGSKSAKKNVPSKNAGKKSAPQKAPVKKSSSAKASSSH